LNNPAQTKCSTGQKNPHSPPQPRQRVEQLHSSGVKQPLYKFNRFPSFRLQKDAIFASVKL
jgi:hypothetical protein